MHNLQEEGNPLGADFTAAALLRFALPTVFSMLFMGLYTVTDTVFVARFVSENALAALNIACPVVNLIVGFGTMLAAGGSALIARKMGEGDPTRASRDFTLLVITGALAGVGIAVLGTALIDQIVSGLGAGRLLFRDCREYLFVLLLFTPASVLQVLFQNLFVTAGQPKMGLLLGVGAGAVNLILDYIFMVPLRMGIRGAALGTGVGYLFPAAVGVLFFAGRKDGLRFRKPLPDGAVLFESVTNGCSEMVSQTALAVTTFLFNRVMMRLLGESGVAAITIIIYTQFLLTALFIGFSMGVAPVISYHYGRRDRARLRRLVLLCVRLIALLSAAVFGAAFVFASPLVGVFVGRGTQVYEIARGGFRIFAFSFLFCGLNVFGSAMFTALSNGGVSALVSFLRTFGWITALLLTLPRVWGVTGVWLAVPAAELLTLAAVLFFLRRQFVEFRE